MRPHSTAATVSRALFGTIIAGGSGIRTIWPGVLLASTVAMAASFIAIEYGGPVMLYALLCGTAFNFLSETERVAPGIDFSTRTVLRIGVALLGARITVADFAALGWETDALTCTAVVAALLIGWYIGRIFRLDAALAVLTAGSVAICGTSAALAISAALPKSRQSDFNTLVTVAGATALSTVAMILYPVLAQVLGFEGRAAGVFLGATIHDVAQVVAASYSLPGGAVESATIVKLLRVAMLVPVVAVVSLVLPKPGNDRHHKASGSAIFPGCIRRTRFIQ